MTTLSTLLARVRTVLIDPSSQIWTDAVITEAIRLAVNQYNLVVAPQTATGALSTLEGLDGAAASTIPPEHEGMIVWGAAGISAHARSLDQAESFQPGASPHDLFVWGNARMLEYRAMLEVAATAVRLAELRYAASAPWGTWEQERR